MSLDAPIESSGDTTWTVSARHGTAEAVSLMVKVTVEGSATELDGDAALQDIVDALVSKPKFSAVNGLKSYTTFATRAMRPTTS